MLKNIKLPPSDEKIGGSSAVSRKHLPWTKCTVDRNFSLVVDRYVLAL